MIKIKNTLTKQKEEFKPLNGKNVSFYLCGPTVYGPAHLGHARTYIAFDIIRKYLEYKGYNVNFVVNITDVHDDMIKEANKQGITIFELGKKFANEFFKDMETLKVKKANFNPKVTEKINEIINAIQELENKGFAYETDDGVYFSVEKFKNYGRLSGVKLKKQITGTRVETDKYEKKTAQDFALWKKSKPNEPSWDSKWGKGRPGWHIECSVMSRDILGEQVDIHAGAVDLIFPHHENEIAQSEALTGKKPFVKYWMHSGFLNVEGQKMSKSLGNFTTIPDLLKEFDARVFRFFVSQLHYSSRINFTKKEMTSVKKTLEKIDLFIQRIIEEEKKDGEETIDTTRTINETKTNFIKEMDDDFNAPNAWAVFFDFETKINKLIASGNFSGKDAENTLKFLKEFDSVFSVFSFKEKDNKISDELMKLIEKRKLARKQKNWAEADNLRNLLFENGIKVDDTPDGMKWRKK